MRKHCGRPTCPLYWSHDLCRPSDYTGADCFEVTHATISQNARQRINNLLMALIVSVLTTQ